MSEARIANAPAAVNSAAQTFRRVVTGTDSSGHSKVVWDGKSEKMHTPSMGSGRRYTDLWIWKSKPGALERRQRRRQSRL